MWVLAFISKSEWTIAPAQLNQVKLHDAVEPPQPGNTDGLAERATRYHMDALSNWTIHEGAAICR